ncbi:MAG: uracil phosphoribosyltransferase [Proteobacteria bacterium]|jgi:uracil phosphoribosyltransferase|nr:uracil phosphoribosyltransferase [Pseudomonadota bacterium]MDB4827037.1 uracil phosphoribosyltransferase [Gammaproteobacteria bacterium]MBT4106391.1 uracil phosphoribosyltransferase [Pseudomonadota bacterium]MBT4356900.1 uracil phosphoribosyltransferase [Pseudomonadota bacterium]MBT4988299.1 uracil phosphoribosyltransferase [Pseudomonadota bacterium]
MSKSCSVIDHPLVQHKLTLMRDKRCPAIRFRQLIREIAVILAYEVTRDLPLEDIEIETPLETISAPILSGKKICLVSILRAGNGLLDGMLDLLPSARVGHIGLYRDPETLEAIEYYYKVPDDISERQVIIVDPMLATANSLTAAVTRLKDDSPRQLKVACLLAAPEGIKSFHDSHPEVSITTAALDRQLNEHGYILPGLGDAGDRIFGTR